MNDQNAAQIENLTNLISALDSRVSSLSNSMSNLTGNTQNMTNAISNAESGADSLRRAFSGTQNTFNDLRDTFRKNYDSFKDYNNDVAREASKANDDLMKKYGVFFSENEKAHLNHQKNIIDRLKTHARKQNEIFHNLPSVRARILFLFDGVAKVLTKTLGIIANLGFSIVSILTNIAGSIVKISKLLIALPFKTLESMLEIANSVKEEFLAISQTLEDTQEQISGTSILGTGLRELSNNVRELGSEFLIAGSLRARIFGYGLEGQRSQITKTSEKIAGLKSLGNLVGRAFIDSSLQIEVAMQSLGMSIDDVSNLVRKSISEGVHPIQGLVNAFNASTAAAREFGVDQKFIARGMNTLRNNVVEFSHISEPELARVTAQAAQLGVEAEGLVAIFNKFTTFDSAAESAALLSQTFGMAIDAMDIIRAEDPLEILNQFREGMEQTGRSFSDLNRHEKALLSQYTGLSGEMLQTAMSFDGVGLSYEELQQKMEESSPERQLQNAVNAMTESVREFMNVGKQITNPFQAISEGMKDAILKNASLQRSLVNLSNSARDIYENILNSLTSGETGRQVEILLGRIIDSFNALFNSGAANSFADLTVKLLKLVDALFDFRPGARDMISAFNELQTSFFNNNFIRRMFDLGKKMIGNIVGGFITSLPILLQGFLDLLRLFNNNLFSNTTPSESNELSSWFNQYIARSWASVMHIVPTLMNSLLEELSTLVSNASEPLQEIGKQIGLGILKGFVDIVKYPFTATRDFIFEQARERNAGLNESTVANQESGLLDSPAGRAGAVATGSLTAAGIATYANKKGFLKFLRAPAGVLGGLNVLESIYSLFTDETTRGEDIGNILGSGLGLLTGPAAPYLVPMLGIAGGMIGSRFDEGSSSTTSNVTSQNMPQISEALAEVNRSQREINNNNASRTQSEITFNVPVNIDGRQIANVTVAALQDSNGRFSLATDDGNVRLVDRSGQGSTDVTGTA